MNLYKKQIDPLIKNIVQSHTAAIEDFIPTTYSSAKAQQASFKQQLEDSLCSIHQEQQEIILGIQAAFQALTRQPTEMQTLILTTFEKFQAAMTQSEFNGTYLKSDLASSIDLPEEGILAIESLATEFMACENYAEACGLFTVLTLWKHTSASYWLLRALNLYFLDRLDNALASLDIATDLSPFQPENYLLRSAIEVKIGERAAALASLKQVEALTRDHKLQLSAEWKNWLSFLKNNLNS